MLGTHLPDCPNRIGRTGYRLTRNARRRSGVLGIDLPAMPEGDRAYWVSTYPIAPSCSGIRGIHVPPMPEGDRAYRVSPYLIAPSGSGKEGIDLPAMEKSIGHTRYPRTRNARSGSYIEGAAFPRPPDAVEPLGHRDRTYWGCRCLACPSTSGVGGTSFAPCGEGLTQSRRAFAHARK
jgi:hypothetical protein